jgi:hypothetical protein
MSELPAEVVSHIFDYLDLHTVYRSIQLVCHHWNDSSLLHRETAFSLPLWPRTNNMNAFFRPESDQQHYYDRERPLAGRSFDVLEKILVDINTKNNSQPIKHLSIEFCASLVKPITLLLQHCPNIVELSLRGNIRVNDNMLKQIVEMPCVNTIKVLNISSCRKITDEGIALISTHFPELTDLSMRGCFRITDKALASIATHNGSRIRSLDLHGLLLITATGLMHIAEKCSSLEYLNIQNCAKISGPGLTDCIMKSSWKNLKTLIIKKTDVNDPALAVNDDTIIALTQYCTEITCLEVQGLSLLSDRSFHVIQNMIKLNVMECPLLTDEALRSIGFNNPKLQEIELKKCCLVTETGVQYLQDCNLKHLRVLNLTATSVGLDVLKLVTAPEERIRVFPSLKVLNLSECANIPQEQRFAHFFDCL